MIYNENVQNNNKIPVEKLIQDYRLGEIIQKRLQIAHDVLFGKLPIKDSSWEQVLVKIFNEDLRMGELVQEETSKKMMLFGWKPFSHKVGKDLVVPSLDLPRISAKSGQISNVKKTKSKKLKISCSRLQQYRTLDEILKFFRIKHEDVIYSLASQLKNSCYFFSVIRPPDLTLLDWTSYITDKGYTNWIGKPKVEGTGVIKAQIQGSLSCQLWIELDVNSNLMLHKEVLPINI